ncbi:hypothetical protein R2083_08040 [Nitrosomonas sp. Is35]|uniref:hypothetical protein n=1 Tax=Nitrosomonas sp. Is35 TaxID=3080534 RepID=UPI00294B384C|nr:hypothetical protein [Nitrosomonas sp. Is35]MDV6347463.1 hypothetical protein [Nitrosomonas sp. Is35]
MANLRIIYKNLFDDYDTLTQLVGSTAGGFPLTNLTDDTKSKTWRSTDLLSPKIKVTWASAQTLSAVAMAFTNLIAGSTFQITLYDATTGGILLLDTGAVDVDYSYDAPIGFSSIGSASFAYGGGANVAAFFASTAGVRRMEIEFTSAGNPDGYIELSRIIAGAYWEPEDNASYGAKIGFVDSTIGQRTSAGGLITDRGTIHRELSFSLEAMSSTDKASLNNIFRSIGKSQPLFISLTPGTSNTEDELFCQLYGKFDDGITTEFAFYSHYASQLKIVEI